MKYIDKYFTSKTDEQIILEPEDWAPEQYEAFLQLFGLKEAERIVIHEYKIEAYASEITKDDWTKAIIYLNELFAKFYNDGWRKCSIEMVVLEHLKHRYDYGERTKKLYDNIMGLTEDTVYIA